MTVPNPEHLLDQADQLRSMPVGGAARQVDLRRSISAAYYALFHAIVTDLADQISGRGQRGSAVYALAYRSVSHRDLRALCEGIGKPNMTPKYQPFEPPGGFGHNLIAVARAVVELQERRHSADYDPLYRVTASQATASTQLGRAALEHWRSVPRVRRRIFVLMLAFAR